MSTDGEEGPLAELLQLADWGPRQLVAAVNARLAGQGRERLRLDPTAGYSWVRRGFRPRPPVPDVVAAVLTERLGFTVTGAKLWPGRPGSGGSVRVATAGLEGLIGIDDLAHELRELAAIGAAPGCPITSSRGADLTAVVTDHLASPAALSRNRAGHERVLPEQVELVAAHVAALRRLDDRLGGGALSLRYVTAELRAVVELIEYASYDNAAGTRLLAVLADLAQLLCCTSSSVRVTVSDGGSPGEPCVIEDLSAEHGRGLLLIRGLAEWMGVSGDERGRQVLAEIAWNSQEPITSVQ